MCGGRCEQQRGGRSCGPGARSRPRKQNPAPDKRPLITCGSSSADRRRPSGPCAAFPISRCGTLLQEGWRRAGRQSVSMVPSMKLAAAAVPVGRTVCREHSVVPRRARTQGRASSRRPSGIRPKRQAAEFEESLVKQCHLPGILAAPCGCDICALGRFPSVCASYRQKCCALSWFVPRQALPLLQSRTS